MGFFLGVVEAEVRVAADAWGAAAAAIFVAEKTEGYAVLWTERRHLSLLDLVFELRKNEIGNSKMGTRKRKSTG